MGFLPRHRPWELGLHNTLTGAHPPEHGRRRFRAGQGLRQGPIPWSGCYGAVHYPSCFFAPPGPMGVLAGCSEAGVQADAQPTILLWLLGAIVSRWRKLFRILFLVPKSGSDGHTGYPERSLSMKQGARVRGSWRRASGGRFPSAKLLGSVNDSR